MPDIEGPYIVTAPLDLEGIKASIGKPLEHSVLIHGSPRTMPDWRASLALADRDRAALLAEVERLTSERDTERAMRIERDGLLAAERERFAVAYDAAQKLAGERDEARVDFRDLSEAVKAAWHQCNSAGLNREQYAALHRAFEISVARQVG